MSTTTATAASILAEIEGRADQSGFYVGKADLRAATSALRAVLALHADGGNPDEPFCTECSPEYGDRPTGYPCPTVTAVTAALSASEEGK